MYSTYYIKVKTEVNSVVMYFGHTKNLAAREYQHNYSYRKGKKKELYDEIRKLKTDDYKIKLIEIAKFKSKAGAKRLEMYLILHYKFIKDSGLEVPIFDCVDLKQSIPTIMDKG